MTTTSAGGLNPITKTNKKERIYLLQREQAITLLHNLMAEVSATLESSLAGADVGSIGQCAFSGDLCVGSIDRSDVAGVVSDNIGVAVIALHN